MRLVAAILLAYCPLLLAQGGIGGKGAIGGKSGIGGGGTPHFVNETSKNSILTNAVGTKNNNTCSTNSYCLPYAEAALAGNLGVLAFQYSSTPTATITATDDQSDVYTCLTPSSADSSKLIDICYQPNLPAGAHLNTIGFGAAVTQVQAKAATFYNIATSSPVDVSGTAVGTSSTTVNAVSVTTTQANDLIYVYVCRTGTPLSTSATIPGAGYVLGTVDFHDGCITEYGVAPTKGSVTPTMTLGGASTYIEYVVAFKSANAGTAPTGLNLQRLAGWSSPANSTGTSWTFQFPSTGNLLVHTDNCGSMTPVSIADRTNVWTLAGVGNVPSPIVIGEFYSVGAEANQTGLETVTTNTTGDCTFTFYDFLGNGNNDFVGRTNNNGTGTTTTLMPPTAVSFTPNSLGGLDVAVGGENFNTAISLNQPSGCCFDGASYGGMNIDGPEPLDENNIYSHYYYNTTGARTNQWNLSASTSEANAWAQDFLTFINNTGVGIVNTASAQATSGTTLAVTIPTAKTPGNLMVVAIGVFNATARTVTKVCTDGATCAAGNSFTQATSAASTGTSSQAATDIWYLLADKFGTTTITITFSGTVTNSEVFYWELEKGNGGTWARDGNGNHVNNGTVASSTATGAAVTSTGTLDFCAANVGVSNAVTVNPKAGNEFTYSGIIFSNTTDAATSLLTTTATAHTPAWTDASGTFNASTVCFK